MLGEMQITGKILDYSLEGFFIKPEIATDNFEFITGEEILEYLRVGDNIVLNSSEDKQYVYEIRWIGKSYENGSYGFGCMIINQENKLAA
jgi:hypothetical protein